MKNENSTVMDSTMAVLMRSLQRKTASEYRTIKFLRELYENPCVNTQTKQLINNFIAESSRVGDWTS